MSTKSLLLLGSGPGIGRHTAAHFASQGFTHIALLSRNATRLEQDAEFVRSHTPDASTNPVLKTYSCDLTDIPTLEATLKQVSTDLGDKVPEVIIFNAARVEPSTLLETPAERVLQDFQTSALALYVVAQWALPALVELASTSTSSTDGSAAGAKPSLLVTAGGLHSFPLPPFFSLGVAKAAQINLLECLGLIYGKQGVHVAAVDVGGIVKSPEEDGEMNPVNIARVIWEVYCEERGVWEGRVKKGMVVERSVGDVRTLEGFRGVHRFG